MLKRRMKLSRCVLIGFVIFLSSCTDLTAVREWSKTSLEATQFNEVVTTYADTPNRLMRYDKQDEATSKHWNEQSKLRLAQAKALQSILSLVGDYMATLATLSADGTIDYSKEVKTFTGSVQELNKAANSSISNETIGAISSLVKSISNAALNYWQAREVSNLVQQANNPLQTILSGELRSIIDEDIRRDLVIEESFLDTYFEGLIRQPATSEAAAAALDEWFQVRKHENENRMAVVDAYLKNLDVIAKGHQSLFDSRDNLDKKQIVKELFSLIKEMRSNIKEIMKS